ncbi:MAG: hypothetical protein H7Z21_17055 [Hymenobacter sp.]|nr:hypothetical protein [Hymenobacter sp.]
MNFSFVSENEGTGRIELRANGTPTAWQRTRYPTSFTCCHTGLRYYANGTAYACAELGLVMSGEGMYLVRYPRRP